MLAAEANPSFRLRLVAVTRTYPVTCVRLLLGAPSVGAAVFVVAESFRCVLLCAPSFASVVSTVLYGFWGNNVQDFPGVLDTMVQPSSLEGCESCWLLST